MSKRQRSGDKKTVVIVYSSLQNSIESIWTQNISYYFHANTNTQTYLTQNCILNISTTTRPFRARTHIHTTAEQQKKTFVIHGPTVKRKKYSNCRVQGKKKTVQSEMRINFFCMKNANFCSVACCC